MLDQYMSLKREYGTHTGFRVFLISVSKVPALRAMIGGAASGSWAIGEPHSEQKRRQTDLPELPLPSHFLIGPLMVRVSLGTTATRAKGTLELMPPRNDGGGRTVGGTALALAVIAVVVGCDEGLVDLSLVGDSTTQTVSSERHNECIFIGWERE
jgi:hypothetical protein